MNDNWYKDIMNQKFQLDTFFDPTKLFIYKSIVLEGIRKNYSIDFLATHVYRLYISNEYLISNNINTVIRNIKKYGVNDIKQIVVATLNQLIREQKYSSISFVNDYVTVHLDSYDDTVVTLTNKLCDSLFNKYYKRKMLNEYNLEEIKFLDDQKLSEFGNSKLKRRILEDYQYCILCEETDIDKLRVVHILPAAYCENEADIVSKDNALLMCEEEAAEFISRKFTFDSFGRVVNISSNIVKKGQRIGMKNMNTERKKYIQLRNEILFGGAINGKEN